MLQISVIQRSKANHNKELGHKNIPLVVANISYSKIESKSQLGSRYLESEGGCCKYQLFKDRKQITTMAALAKLRGRLLQISVIQRSKANHNAKAQGLTEGLVVANISYSKIESKSQRWDRYNRNHCGCCKYQLFKDRKQITTRIEFG